MEQCPAVRLNLSGHGRWRLFRRKPRQESACCVKRSSISRARTCGHSNTDIGHSNDAYSRASASETPCPTPTQRVASASLPPRFSRPQRRQRETCARHAERVAERDRAAIRVHVIGIVRGRRARRPPRPARERLVQLDGVEVADTARLFHQRAGSRTAGTGPMPMMRGSTPALAMPSTRARAGEPVLLAPHQWRPRIKAAAPSFTPDALPAVTGAVRAHDRGFSLARSPAVVSARGCWSLPRRRSARHARPAHRPARSPREEPVRLGLAARCWLRRAKASWSARDT